MATFSKPTAIPRWGDDLSNVLEPPEGQKDTGWLFEQVPPSNFENWRAQLNGSWWKWADERLGPDTLQNNQDRLAVLDTSGTQTVDHGNAILVFRGDIAAGRSDIQFLDDAGVGECSIINTRGVDGVFQFTCESNGNVELEISSEGGSGRVTVGRSQTDGINVFGVGTTKALTFDDALNQLRYEVGDDRFSFFCDSVSPSFLIEQAQARSLVPFQIIDSNFEIDIVAGDPSISFDSQDSLIFNRGADTWSFVVGGSNEWDVSATSIAPTTPGSHDLGTGANYLNDLNAERFVPRGSFSTSPVVNRFEHGLHSAITLSAAIQSFGGVIGSQPFNVASVSNLGLGVYEITPTENLSSDSFSIANPIALAAGRIATTDTSPTSVTVQIRDSAGAVSSSDFSLVSFR